jgi:hypothetical protein
MANTMETPIVQSEMMDKLKSCIGVASEIRLKLDVILSDGSETKQVSRVDLSERTKLEGQINQLYESLCYINERVVL